MYKGKTILGIIPARSGSKGLPNKNIKNFCGTPLLGHAIQVAIQANILDTVFVSTDSTEYANIAIEYGAEASFLRPPSLATDVSLPSEYILHALRTFMQKDRQFDYFVILQPTSPLRTKEHIRSGIKMAIDNELTSVVTFSKAEHPPQYYVPLPDDFSLSGLIKRMETNRQDHIQYYRINGMFYLCECAYYIAHQSFYCEDGRAMIIDDKYAVDIDTEDDFELAEYLYKKHMHDRKLI